MRIISLSALLGALFLVGCIDNTEQQLGQTAPSFGQRINSEGQRSVANIHEYAQVMPGKKIAFPEDYRAHNDYRIEWWYLTANLITAKGEDIGLQWTQFRVALSPQQIESNNSWVTRQFYFAHTAVTGKDFHYTREKWSRAHPQLAFVNHQPFSVFLDNWRWQSQSEQMFPAILSARSVNPTNNAQDHFSYQLNLNTNGPVQLQGNEGYSVKINDGSVASYYYSQPFIDVTGTVHINNETVEVTGKGWLDREWSSKFLNESQQGWDWFSLRLDDKTTLMLFQLREYDENGQANHYYTGKIMYADGSGLELTKQQINMQIDDFHLIKDKEYPVKWHISIAHLDIDLMVSALNPDALMPLSIAYWEGPVSFSGSHQGKGYMELTGY